MELCMPASFTSVTSGPKPTALCTPAPTTKTSSDCSTLPARQHYPDQFMEAASVLEPLPNPRRLYWLQDDSLIYHHHQRGPMSYPSRTKRVGQ